ncbi:hypothetical protein Y695_03648 [Hydrogenophaga sp. T4]|nr:hypothetical protein Y695_03648 [Hydrogenophaga sp. T4]
MAEEPEQDHRAQHDGRVDLRHHGPAEGHQQHRGDEFVDRGTRVARAVHAHRHALAVFRKPASHIGRADRERAAGQADEEADGEEVPVGGGVAHHPDRGHGERHQDGHHDAAAVAVGPDAQRHAHQRAGQHRRGHQQAELRGIEVERFLDRDADDAKHHPHHEADGESQGADDQHRPGFPLISKFRGHVLSPETWHDCPFFPPRRTSAGGCPARSRRTMVATAAIVRKNYPRAGITPT